MAIGHTRYSTTGSNNWANAQPAHRQVGSTSVALGHNGNLTNYDELAQLLIKEDRRHLSTSSDSEVLLNVFAHELQACANGHPTPDQIHQAVRYQMIEEMLEERSPGARLFVDCTPSEAVGQAHAIQELGGTLAGLTGGHALNQRGHHDVFQGSELGEQMMKLKDKPNIDIAESRKLITVQPGDVFSFDK